MASQKHFSRRDRETATDDAARGAQAPAQASASAPRPAVFLDRDGTLIEEREYLSEPSGIALIPGAAAAMAELRDAGFALVLVTNQSAVGRGWLSETKLGEIHDELERHLDDTDLTLDAIYYCPDVDAEGAAPSANPRADRKPGAGMLIRAAKDLGLDLGESWMVGDHARDLAAGRNAGCRGNLLVLTGHGERFRKDVRSGDFICQDVGEAVRLILRESANSSAR